MSALPLWRFWILLGFGVAFAPTPAHAYCILHTCRDVTSRDVAEHPELEIKQCQREAGCIVEGHVLFHGSPCLSFGVSSLNAESLGMTPEAFHDIIEEAFQVWQSVDCGDGRPPGLQVQTVGVVDANGNFFCESLPRANLSVWSLATRWERPGNALGYTSSTHNTQNGEVFDADVELNLNKVKHEHGPEDWATVLGRIAVHEAGHALGLAHSPNTEAVMYESYSAAELYTRVLAEDDIQGICDLYPPDDGLTCSPPSYSEAALDEASCADAAAQSASQAGACSLAAVRSTRPFPELWLLVGLAALGASRRRWRSRVAVYARMADTDAR